MLPHQFVELLYKADRQGYEWLSQLTMFDLPSMTGNEIGSLEWFMENNLQFWYFGRVSTYKDMCVVTFNVYRTKSLGSTVQDGPNYWLTTSPFPVAYLEVTGEEQVAYVIANKVFLQVFGPPKPWQTATRKRRGRRGL
jgi:hypothetical protein